MDRRWSNPARGVEHSCCTRRVVVSFDDETFAAVRHEALRSGTSFAQAVRELVEIGLLEIEGERRIA